MKRILLAALAAFVIATVGTGCGGDGGDEGEVGGGSSIDAVVNEYDIDFGAPELYARNCQENPENTGDAQEGGYPGSTAYECEIWQDLPAGEDIQFSRMDVLIEADGTVSHYLGRSGG